MGAVRGRLVTVVGAGLLAAPLLLAGPAYADTATPIASEPPGGATCLPGTAATCGQDAGVSPSPTGTPSPTPTSTPSPTPSPTSTAASPQVVVTTIPVTGSSRTLAKTGAGPAAAWGYAGAGLLAAGGLLVLAGRRPRGAR